PQMSTATQPLTSGTAGSVPTVAAVHADPAAMAAPGYPLDLNQIQVNILGGFNKDFQSFLFLRFAEKSSARDWVGSIAAEVASAFKVARFDGLFKFVNGWRGAGGRCPGKIHVPDRPSQVRAAGGAVAARGRPRRRSPSRLRGPQRSAAAGAVPS